MRIVCLCDEDDALGFALAGVETRDRPAADDDAVYIVSPSKEALVPEGALFVVLSPCRATEAQHP